MAACNCEDKFFCNHNTSSNVSGKLGAKYFDLRKLKNPIEEQIKDKDEAFKTYNLLPFIPYAGTNDFTSDSLLSFLYLLKELSSSKGACNKALKDFAFGGYVDIVEALDESFYFEDKVSPLSRDEKNKYIQFLKSLDMNAESINDLAKLLYNGTDITGDHYLQVVISKLGNKKAGMYALDNRNCRYVNNGLKNIIAVSPNWNYAYLKANKPKLLPVYPNVLEDDTKVTFVIHSCNTLDFYGRPESKASLISQFIESQEDLVRLSSSANRFASDIIMEVEDADPNSRRIDEDDAVKAGFESVEERLNYQYSSANEAPSLMLLSRSYGSSPALIHEVKIDTKEKYFRTSRELTREDIFINHNWSQKLTGVPMASGWSNDEFINELKAKQIIIKNVQTVSERTINKALIFICTYLNNGLSERMINFIHPYKEILNEEKNDSVSSRTNKQPTD